MELLKLGALFSLFASSGAFVLQLSPLFVGRLDPILNPGGVSKYVNVFFGGDTLDNYLGDFTGVQNCICSTSITNLDCSIIYAPQVYGRLPNGSFQALPVLKSDIYYRDRSVPTEVITSFLPGMRMIMGNPHANQVATGNLNLNGDLLISINNFGNNQAGTRQLPQGKNTTNDHVSFLMRSASCWNGEDLDSADHQSHMVYRSSGEFCPEDFVYSVPELQVDIGYNMSGFNGEDLVLSNGDKAGVSYTVTYISGWSEFILQEAMNDPTCKAEQNIRGTLDQCEYLLFWSKSPDRIRQQTCDWLGDIPQEEVGYSHPIDQLPGCNGLWGLGETRPECDPHPPVPKIGPGNTVINMNADDRTMNNFGPAYAGFVPRDPLTPTAAPVKADGHNLFVCNQTGWAGQCAGLGFFWGQCLSFVGMNEGGFSQYHTIQSAGTDDEILCTLYADDHCSTAADIEIMVLPKGGVGDMGDLSAIWGSMKCGMR